MSTPGNGGARFCGRVVERPELTLADRSSPVMRLRQASTALAYPVAARNAVIPWRELARMMLAQQHRRDVQGQSMAKNGGPKKSRNSHGPWNELLNEVTQSASRRQIVIRKLEEALAAKVVTFFTAFDVISGLIGDPEAEMLEHVLASECPEGQQLVLMINSPGGYAMAAERIANVCRTYSKESQFRVIVPHMAKSAATMVCFGSSEILMSPTAELGPVDPQVPFSDDRGKEQWISAQEYVRSYEDLVDNAASGKFQRIEPFLQQLNRYDSRHVEQLRSAQKLAEDISVRLLQGGMMKGKKDAAIAAAIAPFLSQQAKRAHGRMIAAQEAHKCGLNITTLDPRSELWKTIWTLYVKSDWVVRSQASALVESTTTSVTRPR